MKLAKVAEFDLNDFMARFIMMLCVLFWQLLCAGPVFHFIVSRGLHVFDQVFSNALTAALSKLEEKAILPGCVVLASLQLYALLFVFPSLL
jgi:hypothetical protein